MTKDLSNKSWNNQQEKNEGFSGENLPKDYDPSKKNLHPERETDEDGNEKTVDRARNQASGDADNSTIRNKAENRDRNYDHPDRYPQQHPENKKDRGNMKLDE